MGTSMSAQKCAFTVSGCCVYKYRHQANNIRGTLTNPWGTPVQVKLEGMKDIFITTLNVLSSDDNSERMPL